MKKTFGFFLKDQRIKKDVKNRTLAEALGVSESYFSDFVCDRKKPPSGRGQKILSQMLHLAKEEEIEMYELAGEARGEVPVDIAEYLTQERRLKDILRTAKELELGDDFWNRVEKLLEVEKVFQKGPHEERERKSV